MGSLMVLCVFFFFLLSSFFFLSAVSFPDDNLTTLSPINFTFYMDIPWGPGWKPIVFHTCNPANSLDLIHIATFGFRMITWVHFYRSTWNFTWTSLGAPGGSLLFFALVPRHIVWIWSGMWSRFHEIRDLTDFLWFLTNFQHFHITYVWNSKCTLILDLIRIAHAYLHCFGDFQA